MNFEELQLAPAILKAVREQGYESPTPIQAQAIPAIMQGRDVLGGAQTGTGKTAAFTLPLLHQLTMSRSAVSRFNGLGIRALVLTPTRELAAQVQESVVTYGKYLQLTSTVVFGGVGFGRSCIDDQFKSTIEVSNYPAISSDRSTSSNSPCLSSCTRKCFSGDLLGSLLRCRSGFFRVTRCGGKKDKGQKKQSIESGFHSVGVRKVKLTISVKDQSRKAT